MQSAVHSELAERSVVARFSLKAFDIFSYVIGMCVRLQTIMLGILLFKVETQNICIVAEESYRPIPIKYLPADLDTLPGGFANMSWVFETILTMLFITSTITSIMYITKVIVVCRHNGISEEEYQVKVSPTVKRYKIWNSVFGLSHLACCTVFLTHAGRVCSGFAKNELTVEEKLYDDPKTYLQIRGVYFVIASVFGMGNLIGFLLVGRKSVN